MIFSNFIFNKDKQSLNDSPIDICYRGVKLTDGEWLPQLIAQLNKDIEQSGLTFSIRINAMPGQVLDNLSNYIEKSMSHKHSDIRILLYRVDVDEKKSTRYRNYCQKIWPI